MIAKGLFDKLKIMATKRGLITLFILAHSTLLLMIMFTFPRINAKFGTQAFDLKPFGYQGFLIGENFMKTNNPGASAKQFIKDLKSWN